MKSRRDQPYRVSFFGQIALVIAVLMYLFGTTFKAENIEAFYTMLFILTLGIVLSYVMVGVRFIPFDFKSLAEDLIFTIVAFISIYALNRVVPAEIGISPIGEQAFGVLAGVAEEWFFRLWLCAWIHKITKMILLAVPISAFAWAIFHIARYSGSPNTLFFVFLVGLPLGYLTIASRSADGATFGHALVNWIARK